MVQGLLSSDWFHLFMNIMIDICCCWRKNIKYITPNNDGYNDEWLPVDIQSYPDALLSFHVKA